MASHDEYDQAAASDRLLFRWSSRLTAGASALHQLDPAEIAAQLDEFEDTDRMRADRESLRGEIFSGFLEYLFADGPAPSAVQPRLAGFLQSFHPALADRTHGPSHWVDEETVAKVLHKYHSKLAAVAAAATSRGSLFEWSAALDTEPDAGFVRATLIGLAELLASEGSTWRHAVAVAYGLAKALRPALIGSMSLHSIAILSGDDGGRATPCDRIKRIYNRRVGAAGSKGSQVHFQKSSTVTLKYSEAQKGNTNRATRKRKPARKAKP